MSFFLLTLANLNVSGSKKMDDSSSEGSVPSTKGHTEPYRKKFCMEKVGYRHVRFQQIHTDLTFLYGYVWNVQQKMFWFLMASVWICNSFWGMPH